MDRDATIALFERCEAARARAKAAAMAEGNAEDGARTIAHDAAKGLWNGWAEAMLAEARALEAAGRWVAQRHSYGDLQPRNEDTRRWMEAAQVDFGRLRFVRRVVENEMRLDLGEMNTRPGAWQPVGAVALEDDLIDFSGFIFPGAADLTEAHFTAPTHFEGSQFYGEARFRDAQFSRECLFDEVKFHADVQFEEAQFLSKTWFRATEFAGNADFEKAEFTREAWFDEAQFEGKARFGSAIFSGETWFHKARFANEARFHKTQFSDITWFDKTQFFKEARFDNAQFAVKTWFNEAQFAGEASFREARFFVADFRRAQFSGEAQFGLAQFSGESDFRSAHFSGSGWFRKTQFQGGAAFGEARFERQARFAGAQFLRDAGFGQTEFCSNAFFEDARFGGEADFRLVDFPMVVTFAGSSFEGPAHFNAIRAERAFDLANATFEQVPDFIQAHFDEAPRLDNISVHDGLMLGGAKFGTSQFWKARGSFPLRVLFGVLHRVFRSDRDIPARWRGLKRLAVDARDRPRENEFFSREIRAARFAGDWPLPWPIFNTAAWLGFARFWLGILYGLFSNYGRSVVLPAAWWLGAVAVGAMVYLGEHDELRRSRSALAQTGAGWAQTYVRTTFRAMEDGERCTVPGTDRPGLGALSPAIRDATSAPREAFDLALRTGFIVLDPGPDEARRIYGCLYGVERFGEAVAPVVPSAVSFFMVAQKVFCALMILLFGLAVRNMLTMR